MTAAPDGAIVAAVLETATGEHCVVVRESHRKRSDVYVLANDPAGAPRWVVKRPDLAHAQPDLDNPVDAAHEFRSLQRLRGHLAGTPWSVPEPVAELPDLAAFAMSFETGTPLERWIRLGLRSWPQLLDGSTRAARFLSHVHDLQEVGWTDVGIRDAAREVVELAHEHLDRRHLELPAHAKAVLARTTGVRNVRKVLLHGDFVADNFLDVDGERLVGVDLHLADVGAPEDDIARYLSHALLSRPFVPDLLRRGGNRQRDQLRDAVLSGYGAGLDPVVIELRLLRALVLRWAYVHGEGQGVRFKAVRSVSYTALAALAARLLDESAQRLAAV